VWDPPSPRVHKVKSFNIKRSLNFKKPEKEKKKINLLDRMASPTRGQQNLGHSKPKAQGEKRNYDRPW